MTTTHVLASRVASATGAALLVATVALAACDGDDDETSATTTAATETTVGATTVPASTAPTTPTTSAPPSTPERANTGPPNVTDYARQLGLALDTDIGGSCVDLFSMPQEALAYIAPGARDVSTEDLWNGLVDALETAVEVDRSQNQLVSETLAEPVFRVLLGSDLAAADLAGVNEILAGSFGSDNVVVDLNHVGPYLPAPTFHPAGDPIAASADEASTSPEVLGGNHRVLVVDSPDGTPYDEWNEAWTGNPTDNSADGIVDFVTGHGHFVVDLIERLAPNAEVQLSAVVHEPSGSIALPGFLFTEIDVVRAVERGLGATPIAPADETPTTPADEQPDRLLGRRFTAGPFDLINFSLGTAGCPDATHDVLARVLNDVLTLPYVDADGEPIEGGGAETMFVAAAGNDGVEARELGSTHPHYPAGYAVVGPPLGEHVIAVGALDDDGAVEPWSNECVVNAWAPGTATAEFPWLHTPPPSLGTWSGTSFATAYVTAALADDPDPVMSTWTDAVAAQTFADPAIMVEAAAIRC